MESGSYKTEDHCKNGRWSEYFRDPSKRKLAERAIANYNKSIEFSGELSDTDENNESEESSFEKWLGIVDIAVLYFWAIEMGIIMSVLLILFVVAIYGLISYLCGSSN